LETGQLADPLFTKTDGLKKKKSNFFSETGQLADPLKLTKTDGLKINTHFFLKQDSWLIL